MPDDLPLFTRLSCTDWIEGGWDLPQSVELVSGPVWMNISRFQSERDDAATIEAAKRAVVERVNGRARSQDGGLVVEADQVLARITAEVEALSPALVFVDSFRSVMLESQFQAEGQIGMQTSFVEFIEDNKPIVFQ